jgi:glycosyltransferase involved in cell wall biosynthesis
MPESVQLSVIVPMYREAHRVGPTLIDIIDTLSAWERRAEIVLVDDGSTDETVQVVQAILDERGAEVSARVLRHERNRGKGAAVRTGLAAARGGWRLIMDADNSSRVGEVEKLLARAVPGVGLVAGSREAPGSLVKARAHRKLAGGMFRVVLRVLGLDLLRDTQCGFKLYRADVAGQVVLHGREDRYAFDLEHLLIAQATGLKIEEVAVEWVHRDGGQVNPIADGIKMTLEAMRIRRRWRSERPRIERLPAAVGAEAFIVEAKPVVRERI